MLVMMLNVDGSDRKRESKYITLLNKNRPKSNNKFSMKMERKRYWKENVMCIFVLKAALLFSAPEPFGSVNITLAIPSLFLDFLR